MSRAVLYLRRSLIPTRIIEGKRCYSSRNSIHWVDFHDMRADGGAAREGGNIIEEFGLDAQRFTPKVAEFIKKSEADLRRERLEKVAKEGSSMLSYIAALQLEYENSIVLTQVGSFYELYFDQAAEVARDLNLRVARRNENSRAKNDSIKYNMAGFPCYQLDRYLKILVNDLRRHVVIAEQVPDLNAQNSQLMADRVKRPVTRKISPGTLIGDSFADTSKSNFLLSIVFSRTHITEYNTAPENSPIGLAWLDLSVGSFYYQKTTIENLAVNITRIAPREILLDSWLEKHNLEQGNWHTGLSELQDEKYLVTYIKFPPHESFSSYRHMFTEPSAAVFDRQFDVDSRILTCMCSILEYVRSNLPQSNLSLQTPRSETSKDIMQIDGRSMRALDVLVCGDTQSVTGSLLSILNRTVTAMGSRLLSSWLVSPLLSLEKIRMRQDAVKIFVESPMLAQNMSTVLKSTGDCERILQRLSLRSLDPMELVDMAFSINSIGKLCDYISTRKDNVKFAGWVEKLKQGRRKRQNLANKILSAIDLDALTTRQAQQGELDLPRDEEKDLQKKDPNGLGNYPIIKESASKRLEELYMEDRSFKMKRKELEARLRGLQSDSNVTVSLRWSIQRLYHVHIKPKGKRQISSVKIPGVILSQSKGAISVQNEEWSTLGTVREKFKNHVLLEEKRILDSLRNEILALSTNIRECAQIMGEMDVLISFSQLARSESLVCPEMTDEPVLDIRGGRHLTVESGLERRGENFVSNDCLLGQENPLVWMITGPNMGGKSTFIRQVAIAAIIAQIGCFVPASYSKMGIVDKLFCRVGAGDDLYRGRSTFLVEMLETSSILKKSTPKSLAILDEVGRGTSGRDGLAIAYATIWHLIMMNKCRALFATHFGKELAELLRKNGLFDQVGCYKSGIKSFSQRSVLFHHKLSKGICEDSQGIQIASFSGFPPQSIEQAQIAIGQMESEISKRRHNSIHKENSEVISTKLAFSC